MVLARLRCMPSDPWGDDPPLIAERDLPPLPERLRRIAALSGPTPMSDLGEDPEAWQTTAGPASAADLSEAGMLSKQGWEVAPAEPWLALLPAVWPAKHRGWIRNRVPWAWTRAGDPPTLLPPTEDDLWREEQQEEDYPANLEGTGIPVPPLGRIWLLRSPFEGISVAEVAEVVEGVASHRARADGEDMFRNKRHIVEAAREVLSWDTATIEAWRRSHGWS
jgi:hypothetical protein